MITKYTFFAIALFTAGCAAPSPHLAAPVSPVATSTVNPQRWPTSASPAAITSPETEARITALLARMTVEQKVGQIIQADISSITPADFANYPLGSVLAGGNSGPYGDERADAATWNRMVNEYRNASRRSGAGIPILFGIDAVHGHSNLPGATIFPHNIGLGAVHDPDLIRRIGAATAAEVAGSGIDWTFAPTLAAPQDLRWGRSYEGYSSDPMLVASYARAMTLGLQGPMADDAPLDSHHVAATAKHFLGDGGTADGRDQGDARISETELIERHAQGYPAAIDAGVLTTMVSFSSWNGDKNHGNRALLTDVLKDRMGFAGLVIGDWNGHGQVPGCSVTDCAAALNAGLDMFMAPDSWRGLFDSTVREVRDGTIPMARLDDAVRRVLRVKFKLGLIGDAPIVRSDHLQVGAQDHLAIAREAVARSLVLLKNDAGILPLRPGSHVLITGPGADNMAMQAGGWTITWQGSDTRATDFPNGQTIGRAIAQSIIEAGGQATVATDGSFTQRPDVAVVVLGENPYAEFQGDVPDIAYRTSASEGALIARLRSQGIRIVTVFLSGRPLFTGSLINASDAFVAAWLPGTQGLGIADVLVAAPSGRAPRDFTGRLPFAWPDDARSPVTNPLFPIGYGLDYAHPTVSRRVNEDPRIDLVAASNAQSYVIRGNVPAPWHLGLDGSITARSVDLFAQEDSRQYSWAGQGALSVEGPPVNLMRQLDEGFALRLHWRIDRLPQGPVQLSMGGATLDLGPTLRSVTAGSVVETRIPLRCFRDAGANLASVGSPLRIAAMQGFVATLHRVEIEAVGVALTCPAVVQR